MNLFSIYGSLQSTDHLLPYMMGAAWALVAAVGTMTLTFSFVRVAVLGSTADPLMWAGRFLLVVGCLTSYTPITQALISTSQELTGLFIDKAGWGEYWQGVAGQFQPLLEDPQVEAVADASAEGADRPPEPSTFDRVVGLVRAGFLTRYVSLAYGAQFLAFEYITNLAILVLSILRLLGPLMIAAGLLGDGKSLRQWFMATVQVLLWPVIPALCMAVTVGAGSRALQTDNVVFTIIQSLVLALMALATPFVVAFIMGKGGVALAAGALVGVAVGAVRGLAGVATAGLRATGSGAALGEPAGVAALGGGAHQSFTASGAVRASVRRPGDGPSLEPHVPQRFLAASNDPQPEILPAGRPPDPNRRRLLPPSPKSGGQNL
jgi:hypothetical protein